MTDQELDKLFKQAIDHPVSDADPSGAWAEAESMIDAQIGSAMSFETKALRATAGIAAAAVGFILLVNAPGVVEYKQSELTFESGNPSEHTFAQVQITESEVQKESKAIAFEAEQFIAERIDQIDFVGEVSFSTDQSRILAMRDPGIYIEPQLVEEVDLAREIDLENMMLAEIKPLNPHSFEFSDELPSLQSQSVPKADYVRTKENEHYVAVVGGTSLSKSYLNDGSFGAQRAFQTAGLRYVRSLSNNISLQTGLMYYATTGDGIELNYGGKIYGFGSTQTSQTVKPRSMHYLSLPIGIKYRLTEQHGLRLGGEIAYLMNVRSELTETATNRNGDAFVLSSKKEWGYYGGLKDYDASLYAGYEFKPLPNFSISANAQYGLVDVVDEGVNANSNPLRFVVALEYRLKNL